MKLISIIVPIYRVEQYLKQCLESILNQTYKNLEIILVDDGSPDNCPKICDEYAKKDNRIKVIHKENGGVSSARNAGLENVTGDYISFIDPDDYVSCDFIEILYNMIESNNVDIAECDFIKFETEPILEELENTIDIISSTDMHYRIYSEFNLRTVVLWNKIYKVSIFENLRFPIGRINEDEALIHEIINNAKNGVVISNLKLYYYRFNPKSIMGKKFNVNRLDILKAIYERKEFYKKINIKELYDKTVMLYQRILRYNYLYCCRNKEISNTYLGKIKLEAKENYKEFSKMSNLGLKEKFREKVFITFPNIYYKLTRLKDKF